MNRRFTSALGLIAIFSLALQPRTAVALDAPKPEPNALSTKEFFKPEMRISSSNVALEQVLDALPNKSAWTSFAAAYGQPQVYIDPRSGAVTSIVTRIPLIPGQGEGNALGLKDVASALGQKVGKIDPKVVGELVRQFVARNGAVIGIDATQLGPEHAVQVTETVWNVRIPQVVGGVPVRYGHIVAVINNGNLILVGTETWGNALVDTQPRITEEQAISLGFAFAGGKATSDKLWKKPNLEIVPTAPQEFQVGEGFAGPVGSGYWHRLVWAFGFEREGEDGRWEILVDAHSGEVLSFEDQNLYETKKVTGGIYPLSDTGICPSNDRCGTMQPDHPMPWCDTGLPAPDNFANSAGLLNYTSGTVTTHFSGKYVNITDTCGAVNETASGDILMGGVNGDHDCTVPAGTSAGNTPASRSAFYEVNKLMEQARGWLPANAWLQAQLQTNVNINQTCNAFYSPSAGTINFYRSGGGCRNTGEIAAVFDHEWGHALDDNDSGGALSSSSEAYADIAAIYRLQASCVGYGFFHTLDDGCGMTSDGTGFNANESINGVHCSLDCSGVRDADWNKHADHTPDTPQNFSCSQCSSGGGPCGRQVHCDAAPARQAAWDLVARDLTAAPFNLSQNDAFLVGNRLFYQGSGTIGSWHACTCPSTSDGCGATNAYMGWLAADDDNGNLLDGTPHMTAIHAAFNRHNMACANPIPQNSGCAGGPTTAPDLTVAVGSNSLSLSWTAVSGATSYRVLRSEGYAGCDFGKALIATVAGTSYTDPDVANTRTYSYVVQAVGSSSSCFGPGSACVQGTPQPCAGSISLTQNLYNCSGAPLNISLVDGDLTGAGTQAVSISSNTEHGPENLVLTENPPGSGVFTGTFGTTTNAPTGGDGAISISDGDTIAIDYLDVDYCGVPNFLVSKFAAVDCSGPIISNVQIANITGNSVDVTFDTNEPTNATAFFGTTPPPGGSVVNPTLSTSHSVHLSNLTGCTAYVVSVAATDPSGNTASDDNAGAYYGFVTLANVTPSYPSTDTPKPIPDVRTPPVLSPIVVNQTNAVLDVNVKLNITHTYDGDLDIFLIAPNGTRIELTTDNGNAQANFVNTVFDDEAATSITAGAGPFTGSFRPEGLLSSVDGIPANGTWTLEITDDANADSGTLNSWELQLEFPAEPCPTVGQVTLDKASYQCAETAQIHVVDFSILGAGSQAVTLTSAAEAAGETVNLTETPAASGSFVGSIGLTTAPASTGDGFLSITDGDTATVTYIDADDGYGGFNIPRTDTAAVDCSGPTIFNVQATGITGRAADLTWTTNEPSSSVAFYGPSAPPSSTASSASLVTSHSLHVSGLVPCTPYVFYVGSTDATNNSTVNDNGGVYFSFTTNADSQPVFSYGGPTVPIPDNNASGATASIAVSDVKEVVDVNVLVNVTHVSSGELELFLVAPNGTEIPLALRRGGTGDNFTNTLFDDAAATPISAGVAPFTGSFRPEGPLAGLNGLLSNGTWGLKVKDRASTTTTVGSITSWELRLTYPALACNVPQVQEASHSVAESCGGGGSNSVIDPGDDLSIPTQVANTGYAGATGVVATLSTTTPGVTIVDGTTSYGSLPLGGFSFGDGPFLVNVGSGVPCGTLISFQLQVTANEGSWLDSFTVQVGVQPISQTNYPSTDTPKPIPDVRTPPVLSSIVVASTGIVSDVNVTINITHTYDGDLDIFLIAPNGTRVELTTDNGNAQANFVNTVFDDEAATSITTGAGPFTGSFKPEGLLSSVDGIPANGTWTLEITDDANADLGTLDSWTLTITNPAGPFECTVCSLAPPGEATQLLFTAKDSVSWSGAPGASNHYLYRGAAADLSKLLDTSIDSCERGSTAGSSMSGLTEEPGSGTFEWYLVRGHNALGYGSPGNGSAGVRVQNAGGTCP
jgi:subtilisin-like proprotein convertase family protein